MKERLQKDLISAMKEHNRKKADTIKSVKAAIQMEEINSKKELSEEEMLSIVTKQVKLRKDAVKDFEKAGRQDLIDSYNEEIDILNEYLPKLSFSLGASSLLDSSLMDEINSIIDEAFNVVNPKAQSDMGKIMKEISPKLKNRADMGEVNKIIKEKLSQI